MRVVIKVGTSTLTYPTGNLNIHRVEKLCKVISDIKTQEMRLYLLQAEPQEWELEKLGF